MTSGTFDHDERRRQFEATLEANGIDAAFIPPSGDLEYLTGFPRRPASFGNYEHVNQWILGGIIRPGRPPVFLIPAGYAGFQPISSEGDVRIVPNTENGLVHFAKALTENGKLRSVGVGSRTFGTTVVELTSLANKVVDVGPMVNRQRRIKSPEELQALTEAAIICDRVLAETIERITPGVTEYELIAEVEYRMRLHGGRMPSFDTGVFAMGPGLTRDASLRSSKAPLTSGVSVSFDFGTVVDGYCSDFGRSVHIGDPPEEYSRAHDAVVAAQQAAAAEATPDTPTKEVHRAAYEVITEAGFGDWFRHRTGHCIGLDTHERPFVSEEDGTPLEPGMTFTLEPSIFWPGTVGMRIEDIFLCTPDGTESLNQFHRDMIVV